jgi:zinc transport system substrate-binding protein
MKRIIAALIALSSFAFLSAKTRVVTTIFPAWDWARQVIGSNDAEITMLLNNGVDLHSYQPSVKDITSISNADVFIYVGGESDEWVDEVLEHHKTNKNMKIVNMMEVIGDRAKAEELKEGMQEAEHEHEHEHDHDHGHDHEHGHHHDEDEVEFDEHVWLSVKNAALVSSAICDAMCAADSKNASSYKSNLDSYKKQLDALDAGYAQAVKASPNKTLIFGDRFPFRYLVEDYNLDYYAAFIGCSAETEASFETIAFLADKADELQVKNICVIESSDKKLAKTLISTSKNKKRGIIVLDSMQSVTAKKVKKGATYLKIMESNLNLLKDALK